MKQKNNYLVIFILLGLFIISYFFPLTGEDLFWSNASYDNFFQIIKEQNIGILPSTILMVITKIKLLRMITISTIGVAIFALIKNIINKRSDVLIFISLFLILLLDKTIFSSAFVNTTGFTTHVLGSIFLLIFLKLFINNTLINMNKIFLIVLGFTSTCIHPLYSFIVIISTFIYTILCKESDFKKQYFTLLTGEIFGIVLTVFLNNMTYTGFSYNILNEFIPRIKDTNFFITLIGSSLILFESIKIFKGNKRLPVMLSVIGILSSLVTSLIINNNSILYITFIFNFIGSYYILTNSKANKLFTYKVKNYYFFKLLFILLLCFIGNIQNGSLFFLTLIDILIILQLYNHLMPENFLKKTWILISLCFLGVNIYLYHNIYNKHLEMNWYIKNELECKTSKFSIPNKYEIDYLYKNIPTNKEELNNYLIYYDIDLYNKQFKEMLHFTK